MATIIIDAVCVYAVVGTALGLAFLLWGIDRVDPAAAGAYAFRPLADPRPGAAVAVGRGALDHPGAAALMRRRHRAAHRKVWMILAVLLPVILIGAMSIRRDGPFEAPAIRLAPPQ